MLIKKKIIIWGMGISGQAAARYLDTQGHHLVLVDKQDPKQLLITLKLKNAECFTESQMSLSLVLKIDPEYILVTPGIDRRIGLWPQILEQGVKVIGDLELVYSKTKKPIIAVTGTNGKSTTVNMIKKALELANYKVFLGGNWGIPATDVLYPEIEKNIDYIVLEASSFQLELIQDFCPKVSVITNMSMSHAERYAKFEDYVKAKIQIFSKPTNEQCVVILPKNQHELFFPFLEGTNKKIVYFDKADLQYFDFSKAKVLGEHNRENFASVYQVLKGLSLDSSDSVMQKLIDQFPGIPHRLEKVASWKDVSFYNDSKSTNIVSTKTALASFDQYLPSYSLILFLGGKLRSNDVSFLQQLKNYPKITQIIAFGEAAPSIEQELKNIFKIKSFTTFQQGLEFLGKHMIADPHQKLVVLFSPSFPSFDQFKNFEHRGEVFKAEVQALLKDLPS